MYAKVIVTENDMRVDAQMHLSAKPLLHTVQAFKIIPRLFLRIIAPLGPRSASSSFVRFLHSSSLTRMAEQSSIVVPPGFKLHTENHTHILLPDSNEAFLNPVQEFNRDLSIACIRVWSEELDKTKETRWRESQTRKQKASAKKLRSKPTPL